MIRQLNPELNYLPENAQTIHIMGICGTGMAALAGMLKQAGYTVTGSDSHVYPPMSDYLARIGIHPHDGYAPENLAAKPDLVIVGNVIRKDNPEAAALAQSDIPYLSFPQVLARLFISGHTSLVVTGTHGKTTTCSLLASALYHAGLEPGFMIGGIVRGFESNNRIGSGSYFVTEGDEYDTAFFDKESKFLHYHPNIAIITSVEFDHADIFADLEAIKSSFKNFVALLPKDGLIIAHLDDANVREVTAAAPCRVEGYGMNRINDWSMDNIRCESNGTRFGVIHKNEEHDYFIPLTGRHNCLNSLAVIALLHNIGLEKDQVAGCLSCFKGVKRRQEIRGVANDVTVIDDFAHHPTAVKETLDGLKKAYHNRRLIAVFEPRTNSSRRAVFQQQYVESFAAADLVVIREPVPLQNLAKKDHFSSDQLARDLQAKNCNAAAFTTTEQILDYLDQVVEKGDVVVVLSNGGFDNIHERLLKNLFENTKKEDLLINDIIDDTSQFADE